MGERTIYVLDNNGAVRRSLQRLLSSANFETVAYEDPAVFLAAAKNLKPGCVLLDMPLLRMSGLEVQTQLNKIRSDLPVIVVTAEGDVPTAVLAMKAGASDFLEKPYSDEALLRSIEAALSNASASGRSNEVTDAARRIATLTRRERDVLDGLLAGRPNKLIAYDLGISVRTVEVHRARMMERLGIGQAAELIRFGVLALGAGLLSKG
jgi:two-component system, LuxR family, response regulator FixJ